MIVASFFCTFRAKEIREEDFEQWRSCKSESPDRKIARRTYNREVTIAYERSMRYGQTLRWIFAIISRQIHFEIITISREIRSS